MILVIIIIILALILAGPILYVGVYYGSHIVTDIALFSYSELEWEDGYWLYNSCKYKVSDYCGSSDIVDLSGFVNVDEESALCIYDSTREKKDIVGKSRGMYAMFEVYLFAEEDFGDNILMRKDGYYAIKEGFEFPDPFSLKLSSFSVDKSSFYTNPPERETVTIFEEKEGFMLSRVFNAEAEFDKELPSESVCRITFDIIGYKTLYFDPIEVYKIEDEYYAQFEFIDGDPCYKIMSEYYSALEDVLQDSAAK